MPGDPVTPRPASTVILLRRSGKHRAGGLQVLLVKRNPEARFMPGVWVFPGGAVDDGDRGSDDEATYRACAARELREEAGIGLDGDAEMVLWSRWITPEIVPIRFDTWFYLALAPPHSPPEPDGAETVDAGWFEPAAALEGHRAGELQLVFPTIKQLEGLAAFATAEEALEAARRSEVRPILPKVTGEASERRIVLPGEPGYDA
ncbi:MAG TPA: NUDIX hydrolase [Solirubrobacterales bacterium]